MSSIRPDLPSALPRTPAAPAVRAAQADFFRAALTRAQTQEPTGVQAAVAPVTAEPARLASDVRTARPGSLLDIRV